MSIVIVFVKYNGPWDENNIYIINDSLGILVLMSTSYVDFLKILFEALDLNPENDALWIKYAFELGCALVKIVNDYLYNFT